MSRRIQAILTDTKSILLPPHVSDETKSQYPQSHAIITALGDTVATLFDHSHYVEMEVNRMCQLYSFVDRDTSGERGSVVVITKSSQQDGTHTSSGDGSVTHDHHPPTSPTTPTASNQPSHCQAYIDKHLQEHGSDHAYLDHTLLGSFSTGIPSHLTSLLQRGRAHLDRLNAPDAMARPQQHLTQSHANLTTFTQHCHTVIDLGIQKTAARDASLAQRKAYVTGERTRILETYEEEIDELKQRHEGNMAKLMEAFHSPIKLPQLDVTLKPPEEFIHPPTTMASGGGGSHTNTPVSAGGAASPPPQHQAPSGFELESNIE